MTQKDYLLRMFENMGRVLAMIAFQREIKDYETAFTLLDEQFKQSLGMGRGFIHSVPEETLLALLTTLNELNIDKCWLVATLLKVEGDLYTDQGNENERFYSYLKACNLFLEALYQQYGQKAIERVEEVEELAEKLTYYELPLRSRQLFFWYFEHTTRYDQAQETLFDFLESEKLAEALQEPEGEEFLHQARVFYARLAGKSAEELQQGNFSQAQLAEGLARLQTFAPG